MNKKKGFTLVELIAAIVILAIISMLIAPIMLGVINKSKHDLNDRQLEMILDAAHKYGVANFSELSETDPTFLTLSDLASGGFLESDEVADLTNPAKTFDGCIMVMYSFKRQTYEYKYLDECNQDDFENKVTITHDYTSGWVKKVNITVSTEFPASDGGTYFKYCSSTSPTCTPNKEVRKSSDTVAITGPQGEHVYACAVSIADTGSQSEVKCVGPFKIDTQGPDLTIPGDENLDSLTTTYDFNAGVSATDNFTPNNQITINRTGNISLGTLGSYTLTYTATDLAGNKTTKSRKVTVVDVTNPTVNISIASGQLNANGWTKNNVNVTVGGADTGGSGLKSYTYCVANANTCTPSTTNNSTNGGTVSANIEGSNVHVCAYVSDGAGNKSTTKCSGLIKIDKHAPVSTYDAVTTIGSSVKSYSLHTGVTYSDNLTSEASLTKNVTGTVSFGVPGSYTVNYKVIDLAGNEETFSRTIKIVDDEKPSISFALKNSPISESGWALHDFAITATTSDEGGSVSGFKYCKTTNNSGNPKCTPNTTVNAASGDIRVDTQSTTNWVCGYAIDNSGNNGDTVCVGPYKMDKEGPAITYPSNTVLDIGASFNPNTGVSYSDNLTPTSDLVISVTNNVNTASAGSYTVVYSATDTAGKNTTVTRTVVVKREVTITFVPNGNKINNGTSNVTKSCTITSGTTCSITAPTITAPTNTPVVIGYNTSASGTSSQWNSGAAKNVSASATYRAITKSNTITRTAKWGANGASLSKTSDTTCTIASTYNGNAQATSCSVNAPKITRTDWTIVGFNTNANAHDKTVNNEGTITLTSSNTGSTWYAITYYKFTLTGTFTNNINQAYDPSTENKTCEATRWNTATSASCTVTAPAITPSDDYFTAKGWDTNSNATNGSVAASGTATLSGEDAGTTDYYTIKQYKTKYVNVDKANKCHENVLYMRGAPSYSTANRGLHRGDTVLIIGKIDNEGYGWYKGDADVHEWGTCGWYGHAQGYFRQAFVQDGYVAQDCGC